MREPGAGTTLGTLGRPEDGTPSAGGRRARAAAPMNWAAVLEDAQGIRADLAPPPFDAPPADLAERALRALYEVSDPEFPISVVDLGLVYGVDADETSGRVVVRLSYTATACPCMDFIAWDVRERLLREPEIEEVEIETTWDPPWTTERISERGRQALLRVGVAV
ncbi:MAG: metal-sulfur cluster assembly factor [Gemmatimonadota bacterium]